MTRRGRLITLEGIDGSGKTTLSKRLAEALRKDGRDVEWAVEPTKSWLGESVRRGMQERIPDLAEAFLFLADHAAHVERVEATLASGTSIVCDRWADSCFAYQGAVLRATLGARGIDSLRWLEAIQAPFNRNPDLTLLLDLPVPTALERLKSRGSLEKFEHADFLEVVRGNYLTLAAERGYYRVVPADRDAEAVYQECLEAARAVLPP
ncbi:MAG TPA: dTMP kinase [Candidatus Thermoplasmatota archaeon]|nr:dTMP kinase [Candidatus Thermoplasmatota archaeon]